jgi:hypothetical protein
MEEWEQEEKVVGVGQGSEKLGEQPHNVLHQR